MYSNLFFLYIILFYFGEIEGKRLSNLVDFLSLVNVSLGLETGLLSLEFTFL